MNVYRGAAKDVHRAILSGGARFEHLPCNLDPGGTFGPSIPPGSRCPVCFTGIGDQRAVGAPARTWRSTAAVGLGGVAALVLATGVWAGGLVNEIVVPASSSPSAFPSASAGSPTSPPGSVVPPTLAPEPSPVPTVMPSTEPAPTAPPFPTFGPLPTFPPIVLPTFPPLPTPIVIVIPAPTLAPRLCLHPGSHLGVDACRWPHN